MTAEIGSSLSDEPAAPPRELTRRVRRRSWFEPRVRFWWVISLFLFIVAIVYLVQGMRARFREQWLIQNGVKVDARILKANDEEALRRPQPADSLVTLSFEWNGQTITPKPQRLEGREEHITPGTHLPIRVNPNDVEEWTWRSEPMPIISRMMGTLVVVPAALLALAAALWIRTRIHRMWRNGGALEAVIVDMRTASLAPLARLARVSPHDEGDSRIYTVYVPGRMAKMQPGETLFILKSPTSSGGVIAAAWYE